MLGIGARPVVVAAGAALSLLLACAVRPDGVDRWLLPRPPPPEASSGRPRRWGPHDDDDEDCRAAEEDGEGGGAAVCAAASSRPYELRVEDAALDDLRRRLAGRRPPGAPMEHGDGWDYGIDAGFAAALADEWRDGYDWREHEARINAMGLSETEVDGLLVRMHRIRRGDGARAVLLLHGWPGSIWEFHRFIGLMTEREVLDGYDIVCPSLPGYGFSSAPTVEGYNTVAMAGTMQRLMKKLGYRRYIVQGGDWGSVVAQAMAYLDPGPVMGLHLNFFPVGFSPGHFLMDEFKIRFLDDEDSRERARKSRDFGGLLAQTGYLHQQATKPETLGHALSDSPAGLCAWIAEKFQSWSDPSLAPGEKYDTKDIITNCMIYWVTNSITSSMRFYKEYFRTGEATAVGLLTVTAPVALSLFPHELFLPTDAQVRRKFRNIVLHRKHERGGHFAALENPELLLGDLVEFVQLVQ